MNIADLVSQFHTLEGNYLAEKQRSFGRYFSNVKALLKTNADQLTFVSAIVPQSRVEEMFRVVICLHYKCIHDLWNILLNEDVALMTKILRSKWFFQEGFVDITPEILLMTVFRKVSYLLRLRILKKLKLYLNDEFKSNLYFEAVMAQYGLVQACVILPSCNTDFILSKIEIYNITLGEKDLLQLYKRDLSFPERYFAIKKHHEQGFQNYFTLLRHLALHDTEKYWKFKHDFELHVTLNRKQTAKVMKLYKPLIMQNLKLYTSEFNSEALMAHINQSELMIFIKELLPTSSEHFTTSLVSNFESGLFVYLKKVDKSMWLPLIEESYYSAYNEYLKDSLRLITPAILQLMSVDDRSKYAEMKMTEDNNEQWICYYGTEKALGLIKSKINVTAQIPQRSQYIKMLITTCKINNDKASLLEVFKYFENRHKNDDIQVKRYFFSSVEQCFEIDKLSMEHIKVLMDLIKLFNVKHGSWFSGAPAMLAKVIKHHITNTLPIRNVLIFYFKVERRRDVIELFKESPKATKFILLSIADMIEDLSIATHGENDDKWAFYACYINSLIKWNNEHKKDQIALSQFPFVATFFRGITGNVIYDSSLLKYITATQYDQELQNLLCDSYWMSINSNKAAPFYCSETDWWFARYKPDYIIRNAGIIVSDRYCHYRNLQKFARYIDISEKLAEKALEIFSTMPSVEAFPVNGFYKYQKAVFILANNNPNYINLVKPYFPPESGTVNPDENSTLYTFRTTIVQSLECIKHPSRTLETLLIFLKGDYLHASLSSLYKIAQNTASCYLEDFLRTLSNRAVSARKHAFFLNASFMNTEAIYEMLAKSGEKENNPSLRKFILKRTLKYFLENRNEHFWHLLKVQMFLLNADDTQGHQQLLVLRQIPHVYQAEYAEALWRVFSMSPNKTVNELRFDLLGSIDKKMFPSLSNAFCDEVIRVSFIKTSNHIQSNKIHEFIFNCFLYGDQSQLTLRMDCVFGLFRDLLTDSDITNGAPRELVQDFIIKCCTYLVYKKKDENYAAIVTILEILRLKWAANFTCLVAFHQFLILNFTATYFECSRTKFESVVFVQRLGVMFDNIVESFGESVIQVFSNIARQFLRIICVAEDLDNNECLLHTLKALSMNQNQTARLILVINTLPTKVAKAVVLKSLQMSIIETLRRSNNETVQVQLNDYLTRLTN